MPGRQRPKARPRGGLCRLWAFQPLLDVLSSLVDKSLVNVEHAGASVRYRFLETMRQAAAEQLAASGEAEALADRHRDVLLAMAEQAASRMLEPDGRAWLDVLDPEAANLAAALDRAVASDATVALRLCAALTFWWKLRGRFADAEQALPRALAAAAATPSRLRAHVLWARAYLACYAADIETATACAHQALAMAERLGEHDIAARAGCARHAGARPQPGRRSHDRPAQPRVRGGGG